MEPVKTKKQMFPPSEDQETGAIDAGAKPQNEQGALSRRQFVTLAAAGGVSAGALLANPARLAAKSDPASGDPSDSQPPHDPKQVLSPAPNFIPDWTFKGSSLSDWQPVGSASWKAEDGVITGKPTDAGGGWLILNKPFQDVQFFARMLCNGACNAGVLLRVQKNESGMSGIFASLKDGDLKSYRLTLDANGKELSREVLPVAPAMIRCAFSTPQPEYPKTPIYTEGMMGMMGMIMGTSGGGRGGRGRARRPVPPKPKGPTFAQNVAHHLLPASLEPPKPGIWKGKWNEVEIVYDADFVKPSLNDARQVNESGITNDAAEYGPIALYVGGTDEVQFKDVSYKDLRLYQLDPEKVSPNFRKQQLDEFYYSWGAAVADFNHDGHPDVVLGPYYYLGPDFTERREIYLAESFAPSRQFSPNMVTHAYDFHGNGWPDILATEMRAMVLYVNPKNERRRWKRYPAVPKISSEITVLEDIDGDGRPELVYEYQDRMMYAKYDPADPTKIWEVYPISEPGYTTFHSLGVGDVTGNGKMDVLAQSGWWENPGEYGNGKPWKYHPVGFGRWQWAGPGGAQIYVFDVNGDGLNDVVTSITAHGWGLAWFEQKRDRHGNISFERHMIMDNFSTPNAGGVTFSELHGLTVADMNGDGIPDIITGKRYWSHLDSYTDPDPYGPPVLYVFHTVRDRKAPGGARFVPEMVHNLSGVGSQLAAADLNHDGVPEIITGTDRGNFIFWGKPRR